MGYTHYWQATSAKIDRATQHNLMAICERGVEAGIIFNDIEVSPTRVRFDGEGENGYETFYVALPTSFAFCKTAHRAYDKYVVACLMVLEASVEGFSWSSDGDVEGGDFKEASELLDSLQIPYHFLKYKG